MQAKNTITPVLFLFLGFTVHAQAWKWANSLGGANSNTTVKTLQPYAGNGALVSGSFAAATLSLGNFSLNNAGQDDGYLAIADADGQYLWATRFGGAGRDFAVAATAAANGDFFVAGNFNSVSMTIGGATLFSSGETDAFVAKFNADKSLAWAQTIGSADIDEAIGLVVDADGNACVFGHLRDKITQNTRHTFVRKLDVSGNLLWEKQGVNQGGYLKGTAFTIDDEQSVYLAGTMYGVVVFNGVTLTNDTSQAAFMVKYSTAGDLLESRIYPQVDEINALTSNGNTVYACATSFYGCIGWGWPLSHSAVHVFKLESDLDIVWHKEAGGVTECQSLDIPQSLSVDPAGNVYVTGYFFSDTLHFAGQIHPNLFNINYFYPQIMVLKYSAEGGELWGKSLGGIHAEEGTSILAYGDDQFYVGGNFESDPLQIGAHTLRNQGALDSMYVHLMPARFVRKTIGFLAAFDKEISGLPPAPGWGSARVIPNPVAGLLYIQLEKTNTSPLLLDLYNATGQLMRQSRRAAPVSGIYEDVSALPPGVYWFVLRSAEGLTSGQFIKE
ncbi:MAG: T9SS type A sorting domain-containing protein [Saprospiraceae bacterium]|nr:T9SS type A sorting domain-containing protein [Saprospiraceae bacterium]